MNLCKHGCRNEGRFQNRKGEWRCELSASKCPAIRLKNVEGLKKAYEHGRRKNVFTDEHRQTVIDNRKDEVVRDLLSGKSTQHRSNHYIKKIIKERRLLEQRCAACSLTEWQGKPITLELDHIDGNHTNSLLNNLRLLCPNCHSQTETFRGKGINTGKTKVTDEELVESLKHSSNIRRALMKVGLSPRGANYERANHLIIQFNIRVDTEVDKQE